MHSSPRPPISVGTPPCTRFPTLRCPAIHHCVEDRKTTQALHSQYAAPEIDHFSCPPSLQCSPSAAAPKATLLLAAPHCTTSRSLLRSQVPTRRSRSPRPPASFKTQVQSRSGRITKCRSLGGGDGSDQPIAVAAHSPQLVIEIEVRAFHRG